MDLFKSFFGFLTGEDKTNQNNRNEEIRDNYLNTQPKDTAPDNEVLSRYNRDRDLSDEFKKIIFRDSNQDNDQAISRPEQNSFWPFRPRFFMNPFGIEQEFNRVISEVEKQFGSMMEPGNFHSIIFQDSQNDDCFNCQVQNGGENESLRDYYLSNPSLDVNPVDKKDMSLDGKISADHLERLLKNNNEQHSSGIMPDFSYRHESISAKINPDGTAEIVKIVRDKDGQEHRTVSKIKIT